MLHGEVMRAPRLASDAREIETTKDTKSHEVFHPISFVNLCALGDDKDVCLTSEGHFDSLRQFPKSLFAGRASAREKTVHFQYEEVVP